MKQCLKITISIAVLGDFLHEFVRKHASKLGLEGTAQAMEGNKARIVVCGDSEVIDNFIDLLHKGTAKQKPDEVELEPFFKDKDFRGVFRVIE